MLSELLGSPIALAIVLATAYVVGIAFYRLHLSPVAHFPGPQLAALTFWYEFWYDVVGQGRYTWEIQRMHEKYGPVVRINPEELHINDPAFYHDIYVGPGRRTEKWHWSAKMFGTSMAAVGTTSHELHRVRRAALNPFFSKACVTKLEPVIQANVDRLAARLDEAAGTGRPVNLVDAFTCLSADVIGSFAFGKSYGFLDTEDFSPGWHKLMMDLSRSTHLMKQFGWLYGLLTLLPESLVSIVHPLTKKLFALQHSIADQIRQIQEEKQHPSASAKPPSSSIDHPTILHDLLSRPGLPPSELTLPRLADEALTLVGAGTVTTAYTLSTLSYHLLSQPATLAKLRRELASTTDRTWAHLSQLPYLSACIAEALRLSHGVSHRLQRIDPDHPLRLHPSDDNGDGNDGTILIPAGTPVSMTQMTLHLNPSIFPEPDRFLPERWLPEEDNNDDGGDGGDGGDIHTDPDALARMRRFLVPFSKGTRQCVGIHLAYAELYLVTARLFAAPPEGPQNHQNDGETEGEREGKRGGKGGGVRMRLFDTEYERDARVAHDFFNPSPSLRSKGVRVLVGEKDEDEEEDAAVLRMG